MHFFRLVVAALFVLLSMGSIAVASPDGNGFGSFGLADGSPPFIGCLRADSCSDSFFKFLNQASLEQGFAMQGGAPFASSVVNHHSGFTLGGMLHSFPFAPPRKNLAGKTENTRFSPVLPKVAAAWTFDEGPRHLGLGFTALPPIQIQGASALVLGFSGSVARDVKPGRIGLEADFSFVRARAPVSASQGQLDDADEYSEGHLDEDKVAANCDAELGCIDTFTVANLELLARMGWRLGDVLVPHVGVGLTVLNERLHIQYDDTSWSLLGLQPAVHAGAAWTPASPTFLSLGASAGLRQANQSPDGIGVFTRIEGSAGYRF